MLQRRNITENRFGLIIPAQNLKQVFCFPASQHEITLVSDAGVFIIPRDSVHADDALFCGVTIATAIQINNACFGSIHARFDQRQVIRKYVEAMGGEMVLRSIESIRTTGHVVEVQGRVGVSNIEFLWTENGWTTRYSRGPSDMVIGEYKGRIWKTIGTGIDAQWASQELCFSHAKG